MAAMRMLLHAGSDPLVGRRFARSTVVPSPEDTGPSPRFCWGAMASVGRREARVEKWVPFRLPPTVLTTFAGSPSKIEA
jgi:hypothetical protein